MLEDYIWIVVVSFIVAFVLCLGIGANDVANTFGTSVGAKVLTLRQACILASIFETAGAVFLGAKVSETIRKGIVDIEPYTNNTEEFLLGNVAALSGSAIWMFIATALKLPVSATHSIVGATVGFALVSNGIRGIDWQGLGKIIGSWFVSPVLSGIITIIVFLFINFFILTKEDPLEPGLQWLPIFYGLTVLINVFSIFYEGPEMFMFHVIPLWGVLSISLAAGMLCAVAVRYILVPWQRKHILAECGQNNNIEDASDSMMKEKEITDVVIMPLKSHKEMEFDNCSESSESNDTEPVEVKDRPETGKVFSFLQILTAVLGAFAHGGNDVSNGIGPLISIWLVAYSGTIATEAMTPVWLLAFGGVGISLGLWIWGKRVIETMGTDLTTVTPSSGFCIEIGAALTVLFASNIGLPISSTHCKVGSIVFVGRVRSKGNVDWSLFRNIILSWVITLPACIMFSAGIFALLRLSLPAPEQWMEMGNFTLNATTGAYDNFTLDATTGAYAIL